MARYRFSPLAEADLARILTASSREWGTRPRRRYASLLAAAMRKIAAQPQGPGSLDRSELRPGVRSFHLRHMRVAPAADRVGRPVHVIYYRPVAPDLIEIVRVLHERMDPRRHLHEVP